jgi:hypothetical protein
VGHNPTRSGYSPAPQNLRGNMINVEWYQKILIRVLAVLLFISVVANFNFYRRVKVLEKVKEGLEAKCKEFAIENKEMNRLLDNYTKTIE